MELPVLIDLHDGPQEGLIHRVRRIDDTRRVRV